MRRLLSQELLSIACPEEHELTRTAGPDAELAVDEGVGVYGDVVAVCDRTGLDEGSRQIVVDAVLGHPDTKRVAAPGLTRRRSWPTERSSARPRAPSVSFKTFVTPAPSLLLTTRGHEHTINTGSLVQTHSPSDPHRG